MQRVHQVAALCFVAFSTFVVWESWTLEYYTSLGPGAGFFPFWLGAALGGLTLAWLVGLSRPAGRPAAGAFLPDRGGIARILALIAAMLAVASVLNFLGFQVTMFVFLVFTLMILGKQPVWLTLVIALAGSVGVYHVFGGYLDVQLPESSMGWLAKLGL
ncbi:MAG TPA: tripartite tricarboxylate transporter TctB family protein [Candidatus Sulfotelmatobacter sp.]|nr:tripartite tricarboxylate transporter TctB family protein [Candidatus Sulfotelmatobacter sp.]